MTTGIIIAIAAVVILMAAVAAALRLRGSGAGVRGHFGPEYDRTVARHGGDEKAARQELRERRHRYRDLTAHPLSAERRQRYEEQWAGVQRRFVDSPAHAVAEAESLLTGLLRERGYDSEDALSVYHPRHVQSYRDVRAWAATSSPTASTEQLREVLVRAHQLFDELVAAGPQDRSDHAKEPTPAKHRAAHRFHLARSSR